MARKDFSKPFFMGSFAEKNYGPPLRRPMNRAPPMMMPFNNDYGPMDFDRPFGPPRGFDDGFASFRPGPAPLGFNRGPPLPPFMGGGGGGGGGGVGNDMFMDPPGMGYGRPAYDGVGFPRTRPTETRRQAVTKFLLRCGVHETIIKQLPKDLIKMFSPDNCFLCNSKIESFPAARLHYTSRPHFDKVMKYLQDWSKRTGKSIASIERQEPLKARNLYCELCDVAITSKPHAESHYFGKAHNAIVLGRKVPKNPALHGPDKADRLELLLRRERKLLNVHVKGKPEPAKPTAAVDGAKPKNVAAELYCEVCNITVTCAEQMLSHKNGKKHLTKEKNKILHFTKVGGLKKSEAGNGAKENDVKENGTKNGEGAEAGNDAVENKIDSAVKQESKEGVNEAMEEGKEADGSWVDGTGEGWDNTTNDVEPSTGAS